jgi:hypothetical protein
MEIRISKNYHLSKLQKWLDYELSGTILLFLTYAFGLTIILALTAAIVFLPVLLKVLIKERKYGWLISFIFLVLGSGVMAYKFLGQATWMFNSTALTTAVFVSLVFFYFYCAILRLVIYRWYYDE